MTDLEIYIAEAWDDEPLPERDATFRIGVLARVERRRFARRMTALLVTGAGAITAILAFAPQLGRAGVSMPPGVELGLMAGIAVVATGWGLLRAFPLRAV